MLVLLTLFALAAAYLLVSSLRKSNVALSLARVDKNRAVLQQAKAALIAWAASEASQPTNGPGFQPGALPCPDVNNDGTADYIGGTSCSAYLGRLPYATLGIDDLRDASGERLWYAVSSNFIRSTSNVINSNTQGKLTLTGLAPASNAIAVVLAPGTRLGSQDRSSTGVNTASNYLEATNGVANSTSFVSKTENLIDPLVANLFNDQLLAISSQDLFSVVEPVVAARIERDIKPDLVTYASNWGGAYPFAAIFANPDPGTNDSTTTANDSTRRQSQYIGDTSTSNTGGLLPITASAVYSWSPGTVTLTGGTAGSISGISCASTSSPFSGWQCSFTINAIDLGWQWWNWGPCNWNEYCMINPSFSVSASAANAGLSFSIPPSASGVNVTRTMTATSITATLNSSGAGNIVYQGTYSYSRYSSSWFSRSVVVTIPDLTASPVTSSSDMTAGWFISNEWYRLVYYVVSPGYLPGAGASCNALKPCLTVNNMPSYYSSPNTNKSALLILAGRSLNGTSRPSSSFGNYLEGKNATTAGNLSAGSYTFESALGKVTNTGAAINDRVIIVAP